MKYQLSVNLRLTKWLLLSLVAMATVHSSNAMPAPPSCVPAPSGLVGWWPGEGNANDVFGANNGILENVTFTNGMVGQGFYLNGSNADVQIPDSASLKPASVTVETWVRLDALASPVAAYPGLQYIVFKQNSRDGDFEGYDLEKNRIDDQDVFRFQVTSADGTQVPAASTTIPQVGVWYHLAGTYDSSSGYVNLYVNGVLEGSAYAGFPLDYGTRPVFIGTTGQPGWDGRMQGTVDEVSIYNRALTSDELASIYSAGSAGKCYAPMPPAANVPVIFSFSPISGTVGTNVTISGTNFNSVAISNIVYFGAVQAQVTAASATNLVVTMPTGATYAPITETVNGMVAYANMAFQPTFLGDGSDIGPSSFAPRVDLGGGSGSCLTAIADLDGDGKPDLVVVNGYDNNISLFRNISTNGTLTINSFAPRVDLPSFGGSPSGLAVADVDGDGKLDLVVSDFDNNRVVVYRNISTVGTLDANSFAAPVYLSVGANPATVCVRDLDGDGRPDIACVCWGDSTLSILQNIGVAGTLTANSFAPPVVFATGTNPHDLVIADLDGDNKPDFAVVHQASRILSVFRNVSFPGVINTNSFAARVDFPASGEGNSIVAGDVDGDGKVDLVVGWAGGSAVAVYRNLSSPGTLDTNSFAPEVDFPAPGWVRSVGLGDLNGDGMPDISLTCEEDSYMCVFQNLSTPGSFTNTSLGSRVDYGAGWNPHGISIGDLDGDGRPDIVFGNQYDSTISIYQNQVPFAGPPSIISQPANQTVTVGGSATFSVMAGGSPPLSYQWNFNGTNISGATDSTLTLNNVQASQAGNYTVLVTNAFGSVLSSNVVLTIAPDHFAWDLIPSPRFVNTPFAVTILAQDPNNGIFTNFTGTAILSSTTGETITPSVSGNFVQGVWNGSVMISQTASSLVLQADDGLGHLGFANPIDVIELPSLEMLHSGNMALFIWPTGYSGFVLETSDNLSPATWVAVPYSPILFGDECFLPLNMTGTSGFYRLRFPGP